MLIRSRKCCQYHDIIRHSLAAIGVGGLDRGTASLFDPMECLY